MTSALEKIANTLTEAHTALIVCHLNPDGDCLGSSLALAFALEKLGKKISVGSPDGVPEIYRFLPGSERVLKAEQWEALPVDVAVTVECSTLERAGGFKDFVSQARRVVNLDHHTTQPSYGDLVYWDPQAAALGEIVYDLVKLLGVEVDGAIATCLMTAIVTDTGAFRFPNVTPRTLRLAAELMERGAHPSEVVTQVYDSRSVGSARILGLALSNLKVSADGAIAWTVITRKMLEEAGAKPEDSTGIIQVLRGIRGVKVALVFEENEEGIKVGIRARDGARANVIAESFGGGGHVGASGFTMQGPLEEVVERTLERVYLELQDCGLRVPH